MKKSLIILLITTNSYSEDKIKEYVEFTSYIGGAITRGFWEGLEVTEKDTTTKDTVYIDENVRLDIIMERQKIILNEFNKEPEINYCKEGKKKNIHTIYCR